LLLLRPYPSAPLTQNDKQPSTLPPRFADISCNALAPSLQHLKEENEIAMELPENLDGFLTNLLQQDSADEESASRVKRDSDERAFVERIINSVSSGSRGIFVVLHPNDRMQYMLQNVNRAGAIALLAKVMQRIAEVLEADLE
jgi:hypothetical protein